MYVVREIFHCKPGKVRPLVEKLQAMAAAMEKAGAGTGAGGPRVLTDVSGPPYWTVISELEVESLAAYFEMDEEAMAEAGAAEIMAGYHELVDHGRREILKIES